MPSSVCNIFGTDGDDLLIGTPLDEILCGFGGDDQLEGGDGSDTLYGGDGDDVLIGGEGGDCMLGGTGIDSADSSPEDMAEVGRPADNEHTGIGVDAAGRCVTAVKGPSVFPRQTDPKIVGPPGSASPPQAGSLRVSARPDESAPSGTALAAAGTSAAAPSGGVRLEIARGRRAVRRGLVRLRVSCSASVRGELVLLAGSQRIAHKRFVCRAPGTTVRVRLNAAGRKLLARDGRVRAQALVLVGDETVSQQVLLVTPRG